MRIPADPAAVEITGDKSTDFAYKENKFENLASSKTLCRRIAVLDREAWMRRNANHLSAKAYAEINRIERESAALSAYLPEVHAARAARNAHANTQATRFERGHQLYLEKQEPALMIARQALCDLSHCALPGALDTRITGLIADFDRHRARMSEFSPSAGVPKAMENLLILADR